MTLQGQHRAASVANADPARYERAALRWLERFIAERLPPLRKSRSPRQRWPNFATAIVDRAIPVQAKPTCSYESRVTDPWVELG